MIFSLSIIQRQQQQEDIRHLSILNNTVLNCRIGYITPLIKHFFLTTFYSSHHFGIVEIQVGLLSEDQSTSKTAALNQVWKVHNHHHYSSNFQCMAPQLEESLEGGQIDPNKPEHHVINGRLGLQPCSQMHVQNYHIAT